MNRNQPTAKNIDETNVLVSYRLKEVEKAVKDLSSRFDKLDNIKKSDLLELRDTIVSRITDVRNDLQKQLDGKADKDMVDDLRVLVRGVGVVFGTIIAGIVIYYFTHYRR